ncbi:MAG: hypothetical protein M3480_09440 [Verrucomicrobiota bacterium]|nr:hypothetical protein [Chthoniobacterales bacterium]MDQ3415173.1 hypothetical protein [Verrucomicrobiota bacterium]
MKFRAADSARNSELPIDSTPPPTPVKPENRDYQLIGYVGDHPAGQPIDITTNIFPG